MIFQARDPYNNGNTGEQFAKRSEKDIILKKEQTGQSNSFRAPLLELVIVIGIFAVISVYILKMFMAADRLRGQAVATSKALVRAESVAEFIRSGGTSVSEIIKSVCDEFGATDENGTAVIGYNKSWEKTDKKAEYMLKVTIGGNADGTYSGEVSVVSGKDDTEYCHLKIRGMFEYEEKE